MNKHLMWLIQLALAFVGALHAHAEGQPAKIGVVIPLSGPMADWGKSIQIGIEFAVNREPTAVMVPIFEDEGACDAKKALTAAQKLLSIEKVSVLLTGCLNGTRAILPVAKSAGVLVISLGLVDEAFAMENSGSLLTPSASITAEADGISALLRRDGKKRLSVIRVEDNFTEEIMKGLERYSKRDEWQLVADERLSFGSTDFRSSLMKISRLGADSLLVYGSTEQVVNAARQLKQLKLTSLAVYGGYVIEADPPPVPDMPALNGVRYAAAVTPEGDELSRHLQAQGSKETFQTRVAADAIADLARAFRSCPDDIKERSCYLKSITTRSTQTPAFSGAYSYDAHGLAARTIRGKEVREGQYIWSAGDTRR